MNVDGTDFNGDSALHISSHHGNLMITLLLIQRGATVNAQNRKAGCKGASPFLKCKRGKKSERDTRDEKSPFFLLEPRGNSPNSPIPQFPKSPNPPPNPLNGGWLVGGLGGRMDPLTCEIREKLDCLFLELDFFFFFLLGGNKECELFPASSQPGNLSKIRRMHPPHPRWIECRFTAGFDGCCDSEAIFTRFHLMNFKIINIGPDFSFFSSFPWIGSFFGAENGGRCQWVHGGRGRLIEGRGFVCPALVQFRKTTIIFHFFFISGEK